MIAALISAGADVVAQREDGFTALMIAAQAARGPTESLGGSFNALKSYGESLSLLLDAGADVHLTSVDRLTAYEIAQANPNLGGTEVFWRLHDAQY